MSREDFGQDNHSRKGRRRRNRLSNQLLLENMEPRIVLAGTPSLIDINPGGDASPADFLQVGNQSFFVANDGTHGRELWVTDGTATGTRLVKDINPGTGNSGPRDFAAFQGKLVFAANDGTNGEEIWTSDGTEAGTVLLKDINPGSGYQYPYGNGPLGSFPRDFTELNGVLYFSAEDSTNGGELWRTDGTAAGTTRVLDLWPGMGESSGSPYAYSSNPQNLTTFNGSIYFSADNGQSGRELWKSDGTEAGTTLVKDIYPGSYSYEGYGPYPYGSIPTQFTEINGKLFFVAFDPTAGVELFVTDGTTDGTVLLKDINPGMANSMNGEDSLVAVDDTLYFIATNGTAGIELWKSDGTSDGTIMVRDVRAGSEGGLTDSTLVVLDDIVLFTANDGTNGAELWRSNGTPGGTFLISNIAVDTAAAGPADLTVVDGRLFFSADSAEQGRELWESDGLAVAPVVNLNAGDADANPTEFSALNGLLLFSATDGINGHELWTVDALQTATAKLSIYVDSDQVTIPNNIGIDELGQKTSVVRTVDANGTLLIEPIPGIALDEIELGVFFDTWQLAAGVATNNPDATFSATELMANDANATDTVQMFVNGELNTQYEKYVVQDGDEIVLVFGSNPVVSLNTNFGPVVIELFEQATPGTVDNFLNYINDGDYINSFFHRSDPDFVIQGGGFRTSSTTFTNISQFTSVPTDPTIQNEPGISNLRGTVAMAKLGGNPNSATSQFFVNLSDSNSFLDSAANNAFTVFGQVLDMTTVDTIEDLPLVDTGTTPYRELPVSASNQLVVVQTIEGFGEITGRKFIDSNANGLFDTGEAGLSNIRIYVDANANSMFDVGESFALTDSNGLYRLQAEPGTRVIRSESPSGSVTVVPASGAHTVTVETGREVTGMNFGDGSVPLVGAIDLLPGSDTGTSNSDNITRLNNSTSGQTLQFSVDGVLSGAEVRIYSDGALIGSATSSGTSVTVTTNGSVTLADGARSITATQVVQSSEGNPNTPISITIDTAPPAAITNTAPTTAQVGVPYSFNPTSTDEGQTGVSYALVNAPTGMTIDSTTGQINWTPSASQTDPVTFEIALADGAGNVRTQTVNVTVLGTIPALPDSYAVNEDATLTVTAANGVLANDGDETSGTLTAVVIAQPSHGTLTLNSDGSFTYVPTANYNGSDSFTYQATDGTDDSNSSIVTLTVNPVNDAPTGTADSYTVSEDSTLAVEAAAGVLANDSDIDGDTLTASVVTQPSHGTLTLNANGSFTYSPTANFSGTDTFTYSISDGTATASPIAVTITVNGQNDAPTVVNDSYTVAEDGSISIVASNGVLANDTDPESTGLTAAVVTSPANGTLTLNADGSFTYAPNANFNGTDSFSYRATDAGSLSATGSVSITVTAVADPPTANNDTLTVSAGSTAQVVNVLANDSSAPDATQTLTVTAVTQGTSGGTVTLSAGTVSYTPPANFTGTDSFTYTIQDSDGLTDTATATITVSQTTGTASISGIVYLDADDDGVRDTGEMGVPGVMVTLTGTASNGTAVNKTYITTNAGSFVFNELLAGTYQLTEHQPNALADGKDTTTVTAATTTNDQFANLVLTAGQSLTGNNFGELSIRPAYVSIAWFFASASSQDIVFREMVAIGEDNAGNHELAEAIRNGTTDGVSQAPVAVADSYSTNAGTALTVTAANGLLANDTDADGDTLSAMIVASPTNGSLTLNADGSFSYTPTSGFSGTDTFTYKASDGTNTSNTATVTITVTSAATPNTFTIPENSPAGTAVGTVVASNVTGNSPIYQFISSSVREELRILPDDHVSGNPAAPIVLIEYLDLECPTCRTFHPIIEELEDTFEDDLLVVRRHLPLTSVHPNAMTAALYAEAAGRQGKFQEMVDIMFENQDEWNAPANPVPFFQSYADELDLNLTQLATDVANPAVQARVQRDMDSADDLNATVTPSLYVNGRLLDNADALDDFEEIISDELDDFDEPFLINRLTGAITVSGFSGLNFESQPTITRQVLVRNLSGTTQTVTVTVNLTNVNEATPVGVADTYSVATGSTLTVAEATGVLANDTDADNDDLTATLVTSVSNGTLTLNNNGSFTYVPTTGFQGTDTFTYTASDGTRTSTATTVTINVTGTQRSPVATTDSYNTNQNTTLSVSATQGILANDTDPDGDTLTASLVSTTQHGTLTLNANGSFVYVPTSGYVGADSFTYRASDGVRTSATTTVNLTVNNINDAPVAVADTYSVNENGSLTVDATAGVIANDSDPDSDTLTATLVTSVANGSLSFNNNGSFVYTPNTNFTGTDTFTYRLSDGQLTSSTVSVTITVNAVNAAPTATPDSYTTSEDTILTVAVAQSVLSNDTDSDGDTLIAVLGTNPSNGTLTLNSNGSFQYVPNANFFGTDSFTYFADDGTVDSDAVQVTITVTAVNDAPVANDDTYNVSEDVTLTVTAANGVLANDTDADGDSLAVGLVANVAHGTLTLADDGSFVYVPEANFNGTDSFTYVTGDGTVDSLVATVTLLVAATNDPPAALPESYMSAVNQTLTINAANGVLANDSDADGNTLTAVLSSSVSHGNLSLNADGSFAYTPDNNYHGIDSFTYTASDGTTVSDPVTVTIMVNTAPVAVADAYTVNEDTILDVLAATGVLANDTDDDGDTLTAVVATTPTNGQLTLNADGSFQYAPNADFSGTDSFTYVVNDGSVDSSAVTVTISVTSQPDAPVANADAYIVPIDGTLTVDAATGVLANDTDADADELTAQLVSDVSNGTLTLNADGSFSYTPTASFHGIDQFTYMAQDGGLDSTAVVVTIQVNTLPTVVDDQYLLNEDTTLSISVGQGVLANDSDGDGDSLTASLVTDVQHGTLTFNTDGSFVYIPAANFNGTDAFTYTVSDTFGESQAATVELVVSPINDRPVGVADVYNMDEDTVLTRDAASGPLANDTDVDNDSLFMLIVENPDHGTIDWDDDGSFTYTPNANYFGTDTFTYTADDGDLVTQSIITVTINIASVNDLPATTADAYDLTEDDSLTVVVAQGVLANDTDVEGATLTAALVDDVQHGTLSLSADGSFAYTPDANFSGTDTFTYVANDGLDNSSPTTVTLTVIDNNDSPVGTADSYSIDEDGVMSIGVSLGVLANDTDGDGDTLSAILVDNVTHGALQLNSNGSFTYTPDANFAGTDSFTYRASDGSDQSDLVTVTLTVTEVSDAPTAVSDSYAADEDTILTVSAISGVLSNDTDPDSSAITAVLLTQPINGSVTLNADGSFEYVPDANFVGTDSFTYQATDGTLVSAVANVTITVTGTNDAPVAVADGYVLDEDIALTVNAASGVLANDTDEEGASLTAEQVTAPQHGTLSLNADGSFTYTPNANYNGADSFTYRASDGTLFSNTVTVSLTVNSVNDAPSATADSYQVNFETALNVTAANGVLANDSDLEGSTLTASISTQPTNGTVTLQATGAFAYTPNMGYSGNDSFTYFANDGQTNSVATTVSITVSDENSLFVPASLPADTVVGHVTPGSSIGNTRIFEINNPSQPSDLALLPDDHLEGDPAAPVVLIEYLDLACPVCKTFAPVVTSLKQAFPDDLLVVSRHLPLNSGNPGDTSFHPYGWEAAQAAEAAAKQGKFPEMIALLFENQSTWSTASADAEAIFESYATQLSLNLTQFQADYANAATRTRVQRDRDTAFDNSWTSTPTFFINGTQQNNSAALADFPGLIEDALDQVTSPFKLDRVTGEIKVADSARLAAAAGTTITLNVNVRDSNGNTSAETVTIQIGASNAPQAALSAVYVAPAAAKIPQILTSRNMARRQAIDHIFASWLP